MHRRSDELRKQFYLTAVRMSENKDEVRLIIEDDPLIGISPADRKMLSDPKGEYARRGLWRWAAGGALISYKTPEGDFLALIFRDKKAPSYGGYLTLASGLSSSYEEFFNPALTALREGTEEVAAVLDGNILVPDFKPELKNLALEIFQKQKYRLRMMDHVKSKPMIVPAKFVTVAEKILKIKHLHRESVHHGILAIDESTRGVDLLKIIKIEIPGMKNLKFYDCEDTKNGLLDRQICIFPLKRLRMDERSGTMIISGVEKIFQSGRPVNAHPEKWYPCTPVLKMCLRKYIDSMYPGAGANQKLIVTKK